MRRWLQSALEHGALSGPLARLLSAAWARHAQVLRPLAWPESLWTVGIGGGTLGGSGKTAVALELARSAPAGHRTCIVTRPYPQRLRTPRRVFADERPDRVGDEAVMLARALRGSDVEVWVGPWQASLDAIGRGGGIVILDGVLQTTPRRLDCSVLSLEAAAPWGVGLCPPAGDLAASREALVGAADFVLWRHRVGPGDGHLGCGLGLPPRPLDATRRPALAWTQTLVGARTPDGVLTPIHTLANLRLGLLLAVGRPGRICAELAAHGISPSRTVLGPDHGSFPSAARQRRSSLDAWLTTAKCATKLESFYGGVPVWVLEQAGGLPEPVIGRCFGRASLGAREAC